MKVSYSDISETLPESLLPEFLRSDYRPTTVDQKNWSDFGYVIKRNFMPHDLLDLYIKRRAKDGDYPTGHPYMKVQEMRDVCCYKPLSDLLQSLVGYEVGLHLNLCGWVSTERNWHMDDYLNPQFINGHYAAVWFALDTIHPNSGPFQYVPKSHRWPILRGAKVRALMNLSEANAPDWPRTSQDWVSDAMQEEIKRTGLEVKDFIPANKGDILIWHSFLCHRGSLPKVSGMERKTLIAHYSSIEHRKDMPRFTTNQTPLCGGKYFIL